MSQRALITSTAAAASSALTLGVLLRTQRNLVELRKAAHTDPLTGLLNRRGLASWSNQKAHPPGFAVLMVDIVGLRSINNEQGHHHGDEVLVAIACSLSHATPGEVAVARWGGDEFVIAARDLSLADLDPLLGTARETARHFGTALTVGMAAAQTTQLDELIRDADTELIAHKHSGLETARDAIGS